MDGREVLPVKVEEGKQINLSLFGVGKRLEALKGSSVTQASQETGWKPADQIDDVVESHRRLAYCQVVEQTLSNIPKTLEELMVKLTELQEEIKALTKQVKDEDFLRVLGTPASLPGGELNTLIAEYETLLAFKDIPEDQLVSQKAMLSHNLGAIQQKIGTKDRELAKGYTLKPYHEYQSPDGQQQFPELHRLGAVLQAVPIENKWDCQGAQISPTDSSREIRIGTQLTFDTERLSICIMATAHEIQTANGHRVEIIYPNTDSEGHIVNTSRLYFGEDEFKSLSSILKTRLEEIKMLQDEKRYSYESGKSPESSSEINREVDALLSELNIGFDRNSFPGDKQKHWNDVMREIYKTIGLDLEVNDATKSLYRHISMASMIFHNYTGNIPIDRYIALLYPALSTLCEVRRDRRFAQRLAEWTQQQVGIYGDVNLRLVADDSSYKMIKGDGSIDPNMNYFYTKDEKLSRPGGQSITQRVGIINLFAMPHKIAEAIGYRK